MFDPVFKVSFTLSWFLKGFMVKLVVYAFSLYNRWKSGIEKMVSRINLRFFGESEEEFRRKLEFACHLREISEYYVKYNGMIDSMTDITSQLNENTMDRIILMATNHPFKFFNKPRNIVEFHELTPFMRFNFRQHIFPKQIDFNPLNSIK